MSIKGIIIPTLMVVSLFIIVIVAVILTLNQYGNTYPAECEKFGGEFFETENTDCVSGKPFCRYNCILGDKIYNFYDMDLCSASCEQYNIRTGKKFSCVCSK